MSPTRIEKREPLAGGTNKNTVTENQHGFNVWFTDVAQILGIPDEKLRELNREFDVPAQERTHGPDGVIYRYDDEIILRMALKTNSSLIERDEDTGMVRLENERVITTLLIPYDRLEEFRAQDTSE